MDVNIDIAAVLDRIRPKAAWCMSDTYESLKNTWEDTEQTLPTEAEIQEVWEKMQKPEVPTLEEFKASKLCEIDTLTAKCITSGFISSAVGTPHTYDSDKEDQSNLMLMLQASQSADFAMHPVYQGHIPIRAIPDGRTGKVILPHDAEQIQQVVNDMAMHIGACKQQGWQLQSDVSEATTKEGLELIVWPE